MSKRSFEIIAKYKALAPAIEHVCVLLSQHIGTTNSKDLQCVFDIDDTLIFDDDRATPNIQVKHLLEVARAYGCKIRLVTAREKSPEVLRWTRQELKRHGITYDSLALAPKRSRNSMADVSRWKASERQKYAPILLTVGDQWSDIIVLQNDDDIDALDKVLKTVDSPWLLVRPHDNIAEYGLKLMA